FLSLQLSLCHFFHVAIVCVHDLVHAIRYRFKVIVDIPLTTTVQIDIDVYPYVTIDRLPFVLTLCSPCNLITICHVLHVSFCALHSMIHSDCRDCSSRHSKVTDFHLFYSSFFFFTSYLLQHLSANRLSTLHKTHLHLHDPTLSRISHISFFFTLLI